MADTTYPQGGQGVYRKQGHMLLVAGSSGTIQVENGGTLQIDSGATVTNAGTNTLSGTESVSGTQTIASGGAISVATGGQLALPVTVQATSTGTITNFGVTTFGSTSADTYTLAHPDRAGLRKTLICTVHGGTTISSAITTASTNSYIRDSTAVAGDTHTLTFLSAGRSCELISVSTSEWRLLWRSAADIAVS